MSVITSALTTLFRPPTSCLSETYAYRWHDSVRAPYEILGPRDASDCLPEGYAGGRTSSFSPGICPEGYATGCTTLNSIGSLTETRATCCPIGYRCQADGPSWASLYPCATEPETSVVITSDHEDGVIETLTYRPQGVNARGVIILNQASEPTISAVPSISTGSESLPTPLPSTTMLSPTGTSQSETPQDRQSGLSSSARIGIGVGIGVGGLALTIAVGIGLFSRMRRKRANQPDGSVGEANSSCPPTGHHNVAVFPLYKPAELDGREHRPLSELE